MRQAGGNYGEEGFQPSKGKDGERRSRMFAGRKEGRGRRDRGDAARGGQTAAAVSTFVSNRTTSSGGAATLVDVGAEVEALKAKGHTVDDDANTLAQVGSLSASLSRSHALSHTHARTRALSHSRQRACAGGGGYFGLESDGEPHAKEGVCAAFHQEFGASGRGVQAGPGDVGCTAL